MKNNNIKILIRLSKNQKNISKKEIKCFYSALIKLMNQRPMYTKQYNQNYLKL